jgi:hypothetical protein
MLSRPRVKRTSSLYWVSVLTFSIFIGGVVYLAYVDAHPDQAPPVRQTATAATVVHPPPTTPSLQQLEPIIREQQERARALLQKLAPAHALAPTQGTAAIAAWQQNIQANPVGSLPRVTPESPFSIILVNYQEALLAKTVQSLLTTPSQEKIGQVYICRISFSMSSRSQFSFCNQLLKSMMRVRTGSHN